MLSIAELFSLQVNSITGPTEAVSDELVTLVFELVNDNGEQHTYTAQPILPEGWNLQFPLFPLTLEAGQSDIIFLSFSIPSSTLAGPYQAGIFFPEDGTSAREQVTVRPTYDFVLTLIDFPPIILNTRTFPIELMLQNTGNVEITIDLSGHATYIEEGTFTEESVTLLPGESKKIEYTIKLEDNLNRQATVQSTIQASIKEHDTEAREIRTISQWIPPLKQESLYRYFKFTTSAALTSTDIYTVPMEITTQLYGSGTLDDKDTHKLSITVPTPAFSFDPQTITWGTGMITYENPLFSINPHTSFEPTALVPGFDDLGILLAIYNSSARAELFSTTGSLDTGGIGVKTYLAYNEVDKLSLSTTYDRQSASTFIGISGFMRPYNISNINYSGAISLTEPEKRALNVQLSALEESYRYSFYFAHKSADYQGTQTGEHTIAIEGSVFPTEQASFSGSYTFIDRDRITSTYQNKHSYGISAGYRLSAKTSIHLSLAQSLQYIPSIEASPSNRVTSYSGGFDTIFSQIEFKSNITHVSPTEKPSSQIMNLSAAKTLDGIGRFNLNTSIDTGSSLQGLSDTIISSGINFSGSFIGELTGGIQLGFSHAFLTGLSGFTAGANVSYTLKGFGGVSAALSYSRLPSSTLAETLSLSLSYATSFNIPIGSRTDVSALKGRILPLLPSDPVEGIIITVGNLTSVTDEEGFFTFPALPKGTYQIILASSTPNDQFIIVDSRQTRIELKNQNEEVAITITRPVSVTGKLDLTNYGGKKETGLILTLSSTHEEQRKIPNIDGTFSFTGLLPAVWTLSAIESTIPEGYTLEFERQELDLSDGVDRNVLITLKPILKEITFQGGGEYIVL